MPKVLYIGYGIPPVWQGGEVYKINLMRELAQQGWEVVAFLAGRYDFRFKPYLRYSNTEGIKFIELRNGPNPYFPVNPKADPIRQCYNELVERFSQKVLSEERPDIVHIHDLKTFTASIIDLIVAQGIPMVKTAYNYWDICPQGNLPGVP